MTDQLQPLRDALEALDSLIAYDTTDMEYDGQMQSYCPSCCNQDGTHSANCDFGVARLVLQKAQPCLTALLARLDAAEAALRDARSVVSSINSGAANALTISNEKVYWQREEWVRWALDEVLPTIDAALKGA
jgi:hypothetical protein